MATAAQIAELRRKISEPDTTTYSDAALNDLLDAASGDVDIVAADLWEEKASMFAEMVDISEAGSSRKNSQLYKNALEMARYYRTAGEPTGVAGVDFPTTRPIVRAQ